MHWSLTEQFNSKFVCAKLRKRFVRWFIFNSVRSRRLSFNSSDYCSFEITIILSEELIWRRLLRLVLTCSISSFISMTSKKSSKLNLFKIKSNLIEEFFQLNLFRHFWSSDSSEYKSCTIPTSLGFDLLSINRNEKSVNDCRQDGRFSFNKNVKLCHPWSAAFLKTRSKLCGLTDFYRRQGYQ